MPDPLVEMSPADASVRAISHGDWVRIVTKGGIAVARASIVPALAPGSVFGQHGWWADGDDGTPYDADHPLAANLNGVITTERADPVSGSLPLRCSWCEVERIST